MRIIAGNKRGMRLTTLEGEDTRPTLERVKEGVFSSIQFYLPGAAVLDLFAGSGQMGLEALSRGAASCVFIDQNADAVNTVLQNARHTGLFNQSRVARMSAEAYLAATKDRFDVVFLDPPYRQEVFPGLLYRLAPCCKPGALVLCESEPGLDLPEQADGLVLKKQYRYGTVMVTKYCMESDE